jgi:hypothetical protein
LGLSREKNGELIDSMRVILSDWDLDVLIWCAFLMEMAVARVRFD